MTDRDIINNARQDEITKRLESLADWCRTRASCEHNVETTLTMLERKAATIRSKIDKASWNAINTHYLNK